MSVVWNSDPLHPVLRSRTEELLKYLLQLWSSWQLAGMQISITYERPVSVFPTAFHSLAKEMKIVPAFLPRLHLPCNISQRRTENLTEIGRRLNCSTANKIGFSDHHLKQGAECRTWQHKNSAMCLVKLYHWNNKGLWYYIPVLYTHRWWFFIYLLILLVVFHPAGGWYRRGMREK